jgi:hypothetical protein
MDNEILTPKENIEMNQEWIWILEILELEMSNPTKI